MPLGLLTALGILLSGAIAFIVIGLSAQRKKGTNRQPPSNEAPIPENPLYQRTKEPVANLRNALDVVIDSLEIITQIIKTSEARSETTLNEEIPRMHNGLLKVRNTGENLLAVVEQRDEIDLIQANFAATQFALPNEESAMTVALYITDLNKGVAAIGPGIAGFYSSLTETDERFIESGAIDQIEGLIRRLDLTIRLMEKFEEVLKK